MSSCPNINSPEWKSLVNKIGENNAWREFLANNEIPSADNYELLNDKDVLYQNQTTSTEGQIVSEKTIRDLAARMSDRIGMPFIVESDRTKEYKGKVENNTAYINLAYATLDTPIHEILGHPIIRAIKKTVLSESDWANSLLTGQLPFEDDQDVSLEAYKKYVQQKKNSNILYQNLLKELETGKGKEVLDRIKRDYNVKGNIFNPEWYIKNRASRFVSKGSDSYRANYNENTKELDYSYNGTPITEKEYIDNTQDYYTLEEQQEEAIVELLGLMTAEKLDAVKDGKLISLLKRLLKEIKAFMKQLLNQKEIEIDKLPDNMTLNDLSDLLAYSNSKLILPGNEVVYTTPDNQTFKTYQEASNHIGELAKTTKNVDLNNIKINTETSEEQKKQIEQFTNELKDLKNQFNNFKFEKIPFNNKIDIYTGEGRLRQNYWARKDDGTTGYLGGSKETLTGDDYDGFVIDKRNPWESSGREYIKISNEEAKKIFDEVNDINTATKTSIDIYNALARSIDVLENKLNFLKEGSPLKSFINKNKEYEQSKEIIEKWKKINNIQYNPEEIYSRGQEFTSVVGAYSNFDINLMMQNLLQHIEDNEKAGGKFAISAFTKPVDKKIGHLEGGGGKIKFKIYPQSKDILWAANTDVYSGSVWDASEKVNKDKKSELLGVSYTKYPALRNVNSVQPNLANVVDNLDWQHNELGIVLTGNNFRLEYDEDIPYQTKKIIDGINKILDQKYGKLVKPKINKTLQDNVVISHPRAGIIFEGTQTESKKFLNDFDISIYKSLDKDKLKIEQSEGIQPTKTNETLKENIRNIANSLIYENVGEEYAVKITRPSGGIEISLYYAKKEDAEKILKNDKIKYPDSKVEIITNPKYGKVKDKEYIDQSLINTKIAALKEVAKKYPRSLIRSEVKRINTFDNQQLYNQFDLDDELPFQKIQSDKKEILYSIKTKSVEEIAEGLNTDLVRSEQQIKYSGYIKTMVLNLLGDIGPGKKLNMSPDKAFKQTKEKFIEINNNIALSLNSYVKSEEDLQTFKSSELYNEMLEFLPVLGYVNTYEDLQKAAAIYNNVITKFDTYINFVKIDLAHNGIRIVKNKIKNVDNEELAVKNEDESNDSAEISQNEIGERYGMDSFETNPRDTASIRVKSLIQTIAIPNEYEFGVPIYANPNDVFADILEIGADIDLSGFDSDKTKLTEFKKQLSDRAQNRTYLSNLLNKIKNFEKNNEWERINDILTVASKAYAIETLLLYKTRKSGNQVNGIYDTKVISTNRDSIDLQISREWLEDHKQSDFYTKDSQNDLYPKQSKLDLLNQIIEEGANKENNIQIKKFQEFFNVLGINFTEDEITVIYKKLPKVLNKATFNAFFQKNNLLKNIVDSFQKHIKQPFKGQYGFQNESTSMKELAKIYYEVNPGRYKITATKTADNKSKYAYILPSYLEQIKREWKNGNTSSVINGVLSKPNSQEQESFWNKVTRNQAKFKLDYFNGVREQKVGENGKVRKSLTPKEQIVSMFLLHQQNLNVGNYIAFTLSDKTATMETVMTKEFFVNTDRNPVGVNIDYEIIDNKINYRNGLKKKIYNSFVEPEISRILASIKNKEAVNIENYEIASKLFYFLPNLNRNSSLVDFRNDLYSGSFTIEELSTKYSDIVGQAVLNEIQTDTELEVDKLISIGVINVDKNNNYTYPLFINGNSESDYVNAFRKTDATGRNMARLMVMDMKLNYLNSQIKTVQYLKFDPALAFKSSIDVKDKIISDIADEDKVTIANTTWDEFSKRAAALVAPGSQGSWSWNIGEDFYKEASKDYITVTAKDVKVEVKNTDGTLLNKSEITDAEEFVTMQEHIDYLMSEGKIPYETWLSIYNKIKKAGPGGYYKLTSEELNLTISPTKPVYVNYTKVGDEELGLNRIDYVKSSRYPLIPQQEAGSERDKLRVWMEKNNVRSVNFASAKKLGRPTKSLELFDKDNNFVEPSDDDFKSSMQLLSRDGIRNQQEIPEQKDKISTVTQMNRTIFDGLLEVKDFNFGNMKNVTGAKGKEIKEAVRARLFEIEAEKLKEKIDNLNVSHEKLYKLLEDIIVNDTTGSYTQNDLLALEIDPKTKKFKIPLEAQYKLKKFQSLINSLVNKNVMLKVDGSSFVQVSGVGNKYTFSNISKGIKSDIIWIDKHADEFAKDGTTLKYIRQENKKTKAAQVIVSQYLRDDEGNLIDLTDYITEDKLGRKILDTSKMDEKMFQLIGTRIPNQSHPSTLPIEVVGFLPSYMENSIIVPDGITGQMGSDFDVDKLYAYFSKFKYNKENKSVEQITYELNSIDDVKNLDKDQLNQLYRDIHWEVLMNPATFDKITKAVDMPEVKEKVNLRNEQLKKYNLISDVKVNLPLDYMTSITRYIDNRAGKTGVSIFATLISAQADFQDKVIQLKTDEQTGATNPIQIKLSKNSEIINLEFIGKLGESTSFLNEKRSISENLNMMFSESVDNAKNQFLKEFNWTEKAMSPIGVLAMLTDNKGNAAPIDFMMDLTSQSSIITLFEMIEQKQDSFGQYDSNALSKSVIDLQNKIIKKIDLKDYLPGDQTAQSYFDNKERNKILDAETLSNAWVIGKAIQQKANNETLEKIAKDLKYSSVNKMMLTYYNVQFNTLDTFARLEDTGRELMTILGAVYPYTKGIGSNVFSTKQKLNQLNKLSNSFVFNNLDNIAGEINKLDNGDIQIMPVGEIGSAIENSLIFAQNNVYKSLFPISSGNELESTVDKILDFMGLDKLNLSKDKYQSIYNTVFESIISYIYTNPSFELFEDVVTERNKLINGTTSIGYRIIELKKDPEFAKNGFLKNIEVNKDYKTNTYSISFKDPFGTESDDKEVTLGFYNLALNENNDIKQLAKDLALYPFATGDAGNLGRFIPVSYLNSDADFTKAMGNFENAFVKHLINPGSQDILIDQIVQNNPDIFSKSFSFTTTKNVNGDYQSPFKTVLKKIVNADKLKDVDKFTFKIGDFPNNDKYKGIIQSLKIPLTDNEQQAISNIPSLAILKIDFKYPQYILIEDEIKSDIDFIYNEKVSYLYKRTSPIVTENGDATYERIEILGYKNISEFDFNNPNLVSAIEMNNVSRNENELPSQEGVLNQKEEIIEPITFVENKIPVNLKGQMTFKYGNNKRSDVTSNTTFDAILNGERTASTRYENEGNINYWKGAKIGDIITWKSEDGKTVDVEVTKALHSLKGSGKNAEEWSKLEGWSVDYFNEKVRPKLDQAWQIEYKLITQPSTNIQENVKEPTEQPEIKINTVEYKGKPFIIEGSEEEGGLKIFYQAQGGKGEEVKDVNLFNKVFVAHTADIHPEWVVTLTGIQNQPKYLVGMNGEVISLQNTDYGKVIQSKNVIQKVMSLYNDKSEIENLKIKPEETSMSTENVFDITEEDLPVEEKPVKKEKRINVPKGSNPNNNVIMETEDTVFLMNDGQQEAFDFIKGKVEELLNNKKRIDVNDLDNTVIFNDPLTNKFNGLFPVEMWNNMIGLAGRGGVGKTTVIKAIIAAIEGKNKYAQPSVMYLAPSHTAATVLQEAIGLDSEKANDGKVNTIQSHLRMRPDNNNIFNLISENDYLKSTMFKPSFGRPNIIIIDESSMVSATMIKDMIIRLKTDLKNGLISNMPVFIFMGDYRQLGPINEKQNEFVNKGPVSSTLFLDTSKTKELTEVMRSDNELLHKIYDSIGEQTVSNMIKTKNKEELKNPTFSKYDQLTKKSTENMLIVSNQEGVIDDYVTYLANNNNPYGMFWIHYNNTDNPITKNLAAKIRKAYFDKIEESISEEQHRLFSKHDYIEFTGGVEISTDDSFDYTVTNDKIKNIIEKQKYYKVKDNIYKIKSGVIKPNARFKVLDIVNRKDNLLSFVHSQLKSYLPKNITVDVETSILYNRQDKVRALSKALDISVGPIIEGKFGKYNKNTKKQEGIIIKNNKTGEILAEFDLPYGIFIDVQENLKMLNSSGATMPFAPAYIGSSHTAQGNSIKNVIVGDYNIKQAAANGKTHIDDIFSSMYVALTRTSGTVIIIKPAGADIVNNQEVFLGAITDNNQAQRMTSASKMPNKFEEIEIQEAEETIDFMDNVIQQIIMDSQKEVIEDTFGKDKNASSILNTVYKNTTPFYKEILKLVSKTGGINNLKIVVDETITDPGSYDLYNETITINPNLAFESNPGNANALYDVLIHELLHHITAKIVNADKSKLTLEQRKWVVSLENLFKFTQDKILNDPIHGENLRKAIEQVNKEGGFLSVKDKSMYYGLTNMNEFISMLMSDADFRSFMNNVSYSGEKSLFERFIDIFVNILKSLGITVKDDTVLKEGIGNIIGIIESRNEGNVATDQTLKSIKTQTFVDGIVESEFEKIIKYLDIKTKCK